MLVYLVLKAEIPNWLVLLIRMFILMSYCCYFCCYCCNRKCNLLYIKDFHFSQVGNEELQWAWIIIYEYVGIITILIRYYLASFEAAVEYITSGDLQVRKDCYRWMNVNHYCLLCAFVAIQIVLCRTYVTDKLWGTVLNQSTYL